MRKKIAQWLALTSVFLILVAVYGLWLFAFENRPWNPNNFRVHVAAVGEDDPALTAQARSAQTALRCLRVRGQVNETVLDQNDVDDAAVQIGATNCPAAGGGELGFVFPPGPTEFIDWVALMASVFTLFASIVCFLSGMNLIKTRRKSDAVSAPISGNPKRHRDWTMVFIAFPFALYAFIYFDFGINSDTFDTVYGAALMRGCMILIALLLSLHELNGRVNRFFDSILARVQGWVKKWTGKKLSP